MNELTSDVQRKNRVLVLGDGLVRAFSKILNKLMGTKFYVTSFVKHNAIYEDIISDVDPLTKHFNTKDYVIIAGGLRNCLQGSRLDSSVFNKIRRISERTNVILLSVPLWSNRVILNGIINDYNKMIYNHLFLANPNKSRVTYLSLNAVVNSFSFNFNRTITLKYRGKEEILRYLKQVIYNEIPFSQRKIILLEPPHCNGIENTCITVDMTSCNNCDSNTGNREQGSSNKGCVPRNLPSTSMSGGPNCQTAPFFSRDQHR